jgi:hypothetical protein
MHMAAEVAPVNGAINGRGVKHLKLSRRISQAADVATHVKRLDPSLGQICSAYDISPAALRAELKARAAANGNGSSDKVKHFVQTFVDGWIDLSEAERMQAFQAIDGPDIWKTLANFVA